MAEPGRASDAVLITFPPSLDSELGRFLCQHYGIDHQERRHTLIFSSFVTLWHGRTVIFPLLYSRTYKLAGPREMVDYLDTRCAPDLQLLPRKEDEQRQVESDWTLFNQSLALATAKFAYYHLLPHRDLMVRPLSQDAPAFEQKCVAAGYGFFAWLLRTLLKLSAKTAQESLDQIRTIFTAVEGRISAGQKFLVGDRLSLSDLAFAVAAAPVVLPDGYGGPIPPLASMPAEVQAAVKEMRGRPAGAFALAIYAEQRSKFGTSVLTKNLS
jgi:glutathione S-transferase